MRISKIASTSMVMALAGAFFVGGMHAGATTMTWTVDANFSNEWDFSDIDTTEGEWDADRAAPGDADTWAHHANGSDSRRTHNVPATGGVGGDGEFYHTPTVGEFIYSPDVDVFSLDPWSGVGELDEFAPPAPTDPDGYRFAGVGEFGITTPFQNENFDSFRAAHGSLPGQLTSTWNVALSNRPEADVSEDDLDLPNELGTNVVQGWNFNLIQPFDQLQDWQSDGEGNDIPISSGWLAVDGFDDTYAQIRLGTTNGYADAGYLFFASNDDTLFGPGLSTQSEAGGIRPFANTWQNWTDWDSFETTEGDDYYHAGLTAVGGSITTSVVPEPASMTLLGLGLAGFATRRVMSRKKKA